MNYLSIYLSIYLFISLFVFLLPPGLYLYPMHAWQHLDGRADTLSQLVQRIGFEDLCVRELFSLEEGLPEGPLLGVMLQLE